MKSWWTAAFGILGGLLGAGLILLVSSPPRGKPVTLLPAPTPAPIRVHITGAVRNQGVYALSAGSRAQDAIDAAGGPLPEANDQGVNLAAVLADGERVAIPTKPAPPASAGTSGSVPLAEPAPPGLIDLNTATLQELDTLPGVGPATAQKIIAYREAHGPFPDIESIQDVPGIGPATYERLRDLITVSP